MKRPSVALLLLATFVAATTVATALALRSWLVVLLGAPGLLALATSVTLPRSVERGAVLAARGIAGAAVAFSFASTFYPVFPDTVVAGVATAGGHALAALAALLLLARVVPVGGGLLIATLGALVCATLPPEVPRFRSAGAVAATAFVAWLVMHDDDHPFATTPPASRWAAALFLVLTAAIAGAIAHALPIAQPKVELMVAEMINAEGQASIGMSTESRLGDVERLARSTRIAARVWADAPHDLRVRSFTRFDGRTWRAAPRPGRRLEPVAVAEGRWPARDATPGRDLAVPGATLEPSLAASRIVVRSAERGAMPAPAHSRAVRLETSGEVVLAAGDVLVPDGAAALYAVLSAAGDPSAPAPGPDTLEVPPRLDPRVRALADEVARGAASDDEKLARVLAHFHSGYRYTLDVGPFRTGDPLAEFLFEKRKGYCEYFASATTLLLRLQGIPSRYVTGYAVRSFQRTGDHYLVRDSDAHAWAEAWIPGRGWVEVDATPPADYEALHGDVPRSVFDPLRAFWDALAARWAQGGAGALARALAESARRHPVATALVVAALVAWRARRRSRSRAAASPAPPPAAIAGPLRDLLADVDALCATRGAARPPSRAPREHVAHAQVRLTAEERAACLAAVELVYAGAYGGTVAPAGQLAEAARRLRALPPPPAGGIEWKE